MLPELQSAQVLDYLLVLAVQYLADLELLVLLDQHYPDFESELMPADLFQYSAISRYCLAPQSVQVLHCFLRSEAVDHLIRLPLTVAALADLLYLAGFFQLNLE